MVSLTTQKNFRSVQHLPFCYICGRDFIATDQKDRDHVPPECIFLKEDREPLWLPTHVSCNVGQTTTDEKIGQLIALRYGKTPKIKNRRLKITLLPDPGVAALTNLNVEAAVWRWVSGFHAALYRQPIMLKSSGGTIRGSLVTPFPKAPMNTAAVAVEPLKPQHLAFVQTIKLNRISRNLDRISCNKGKLIYECVWYQSDNNGPWMCIFALDVYDWKDLGGLSEEFKRGCAGFYVLLDGGPPAGATRGVDPSIEVQNLDRLDPFAP